jgi:alanine-synthesizing transaminase
MPSRTTAAIPVASRISGFSYAIRNIVAEARKVEAAGGRVRYLNIGDPIIFGFRTPAHLIEAVERAIRDGHNGYAPSVGIPAAREAIAAECERRGMPVTPDRAVVTAGTSEGIELALTALAGPGDSVLVPVPTYPLYTAVLAKIGAKPIFYNTQPGDGWVPDVREIARLITPSTRALVVIDPNNPTGASYPVKAEP